MMGEPQQSIGIVPGSSRHPTVSGAIVASIRSMLLEQGCWEGVRAAYVRRRPQDADWLDERMWSTWIDLDRHVTLLEAASDVLGLDGMRALGRRRVEHELQGGVFVGMVRSWLRSFDEYPGYLLRIVPYLWRTAFRDCGDMVLVDHDDARLWFRLVGPPPHLRRSEAWRALLAGFADGLLELVRVHGDMQLDLLGEEEEVLDLRVSWTPPAA